MGPIAPLMGMLGPLLSAGTSLMGAFGAKDTGKANAAAIGAQTDEEARRMVAQNERTEARARATAAASGTTMAGTPSSFLDAMQKENQAELDYFRRTGQQKQGAARAEGDAAFQSGLAGAVGGIGSAFGGFGGGGGSSGTAASTGSRPNQNTWLYM